MVQLEVLIDGEQQLLNFRQASSWATKYTKKSVSVSNISYLVQYGRLKRYDSNGQTLISKDELKNYYDANNQEAEWRKKLGDDLNWHLSFSEYKESERTKHVHRLHPYKGKFIPQLVEYFLDTHTDEFKKEVFFNRGDIILDPFCGSGTTLVQCSELGLHSIGIDISAFNSMMSNAKVKRYNIDLLHQSISSLTNNLLQYKEIDNYLSFERELTIALSDFNSKYFPSPGYRRMVSKKEINEREYSSKKEVDFLKVFNELVKKHKIKTKQETDESFLDKWFVPSVRKEIDSLFAFLKTIDDKDVKMIMAIILSRTVRSCRATTHADLGTLKEPTTTTYYCKKHGKMCKPIYTIRDWWQRYAKDTLKRLQEFDRLRTQTYQICLAGDSCTIGIIEELQKRMPKLAKLVSEKKIDGIFSSPPYVGLIDYHEQHAYSYEIFGFERKDELEIGALSRGQGKEAQGSYVEGIANSLMNCKKLLKDDYDVFLVANDKYNLYPTIAKKSGMKIVNQYKRPVLNRVEKDRSNAYAEVIFHLKER